VIVQERKEVLKMQLLFLVIKRVELVDEIMHSLASAGIRGGTCIDSMGMAKSISDMDNLPMIGVLRALLSGEDPDQKGKTIFVAVKDDQVQTARDAIVSVTGDLTQPNAGVLFGVPITFAEGIN
jgi:nitrogen regulatory protein PII